MADTTPAIAATTPNTVLQLLLPRRSELIPEVTESKYSVSFLSATEVSRKRSLLIHVHLFNVLTSWTWASRSVPWVELLPVVEESERLGG